MNMKYFKTENHLIFGLILILLSTAIFMIEPSSLKDSSGLFTFLFFVHYSLPILYCLVIKTVLSKGYFTLFGSKTLSFHIILLILFNISAFSLNREMIVFYESAAWLSVLIVIENILLALVAFLKSVPKWLRVVLIFLAPLFLLFHLHQSFIVLPMTMFGILGGLFLGVGLLLFVPIFYIVAYIRILQRLSISLKDLKISLTGIIPLVLIIAYYMISWNGIDKKIRNGYLNVDTPFQESNLPEWVVVSKNIDDSYLTEAFLKSNLVYQQYERFGFSGRGFSRYNEKIIHDPLIAICMGFDITHSMDEKSRIKVLNFLYDKRHQTAGRFWRGDHLITDQVVTNVQVFSKERLTYSELLLTISNEDRRNRWRQQEEAIYTFQLPQGGVITSLSLWVEGIEEKAILTTKSKAENAYNTIVGRERRDPSVIYWMEGNKARIRVFPCTPEEKRKIRVGITAPMKIKNQKLFYQPITFEGPDHSKAKTQINIVPNGAEINSAYSFQRNNQVLSWVGKYHSEWYFQTPITKIEPSYFSYKDQTYVSEETPTNLKPFDFEKVYLDVTNHWTDQELELITKLFDNQSIKILEGPFDTTSTKLFPNFTLFPYYQLQSNKSIVITKGGMNTPNLEDIKNSSFHDHLFNYFEESSHPVLVLDIGESPSDFNKSLKEFGVISHHQATMKQLEEYVKQNKFPDPSNPINMVHVAGNGLSIKKTDTNKSTTGSDHLMRLFYYQAIMDEIGKRYFGSNEKSYIEKELTSAASVANVVTPVSSLIVLETQQDYERFDIERNKDSLGNASIKNQGAVPEPHEWALIIVGMLLMGWFYFKQYM